MAGVLETRNCRDAGVRAVLEASAGTPFPGKPVALSHLRKLLVDNENNYQ